MEQADAGPGVLCKQCRGWAAERRFERLEKPKNRSKSADTRWVTARPVLRGRGGLGREGGVVDAAALASLDLGLMLGDFQFRLGQVEDLAAFNTVGLLLGQRPAAPRRQPDLSGPFQLQEQRARGHILGPALGVTPVPARAQFAAQARAVPVGIRAEQAANQIEVRLANCSPLNDLDAGHAPQITASAAAEYSRKRESFSLAL